MYSHPVLQRQEKKDIAQENALSNAWWNVFARKTLNLSLSFSLPLSERVEWAWMALMKDCGTVCACVCLLEKYGECVK